MSKFRKVGRPPVDPDNYTSATVVTNAGWVSCERVNGEVIVKIATHRGEVIRIRAVNTATAVDLYVRE